MPEQRQTVASSGSKTRDIREPHALVRRPTYEGEETRRRISREQGEERGSVSGAQCGFVRARDRQSAARERL